MRIADFLWEFPLSLLDRPAWIDRGKDGLPISECLWRDVQQMVGHTAEFLLDQGVSVGDRVANLYPNSLQWAVLDVACSSINAIHAPLDPRLSPLQKQHCLGQLEPSLVFVAQPFPSTCNRIFQWDSIHIGGNLRSTDKRRDYSPNDVANILFTSGTTSNPLGVMLTHKNLVSNAIAKLNAMPQSCEDHRLNVLPFAHAYARTCELTTWIMSRSSMESTSSIDSFLDSAPASAPTLINGVPRLYEEILTRWRQIGANADGLRKILGSRIRQLASGGAGLREATRIEFEKAGYPIFQGYGLTEASPTVCSNRAATANNEACLNGVGPVVQGTQVRIDEDSRLWVSGDGVMRGYWRSSEDTHRRIVNGWLNTGDIAEWMGNGNDDSSRSIQILGRADDVIVLNNGYKVNPMKIEQELYNRFNMEQCIVIGNNRPYTVLLLVHETNSTHELARDPLTIAQIQEALLHFPTFQVPKKIIRMSEKWTGNSPLCNFKGAVVRRRVEQAYQASIDAAYSGSL